jgi:hypothetical protein
MFGEFVEVAPLFVLKTHSERKAGDTSIDAPGTPLASSKQLKASWSSEHSEPLKPDELLALSELLALTDARLGRASVDAEKAALSEFFHRVSPIRAKQIEKALDRAVLAKGTEMHIRFYIEQMELALRRRGK